MRLNKPITAVTAVGLLALSACGGSGNTNNVSNSPAQTTESQITNTGAAGQGKDPTRQAPAAPIPGAKTGGTLTVEVNGGTETMDPTEAYYTDTSSILSGLVIRSLTQYVYDPKTGEMILVPDLATDLGTPSNNYKTWKFTLRSGIKFENGQPVTPEDIKYGIERSFDRSTFPGGANYSNQYFLHGDTYKGPYKSGNYDGVTIKGNTITIQMSQPFPDMPYWGAFPAMSPIPPGKASDPSTYKNHPWATGPYKFAQYTPGQSLTLVKNTQWDPKTDPGRHQYINDFKFAFTVDSAKIDQTILADHGAGQTTISYDPVLAADYQQFKTQAPDQLVKGGEPCTFMVYPDNRLITNIDVRRAIAYAYPYQAAWAAGGYIQGVTRIPAYNVMPPGIPGRVQYNPLPGHTPGSTDPAKAKQLLTKAHAVGYVLKWPYQTDIPQSVSVKNVVQQAMTQAGFKFQPVATTSANYVNDILTNPKAPVNMRSVGWCSDWPSGSSWMPPEFQSTDIKTEGFGSNYEAFSSKVVDDKIKAVQLLPLSKQPAAWNALDKFIMTKYFPVILTGYGAAAMMTGTKVMNFHDDTVFGMPTWKDMWLS
jgi:peptide/nickel transport system substrate-binding protein